MRRQILILLLATGCAAESLGSAPIAGTGTMISASSADPTSSTSSDSSSTDTTGEPGPCAAYLGCLEQCASADCMDDCAEITGVDVDVCMQIQCMAWQDACAHDDPQACERLPECAAGHETSTSAATETAGSTGTGSTDTGATESSSGSSEDGGSSSSTG